MDLILHHILPQVVLVVFFEHLEENIIHPIVIMTEIGSKAQMITDLL